MSVLFLPIFIFIRLIDGDRSSEVLQLKDFLLTKYLYFYRLQKLPLWIEDIRIGVSY